MEKLAGELELVRRFKNGDHSVFGAIMAHYEPYVLGLLMRMAPNRAQAEDLCQETFLKVLKGLNRFKGGSELKTWIFRVAHNVAFDSFRSPESRADSLDALAEDGMQDPVAHAPLPSDNVDEGAMRQAVEKALGNLPRTQREVLHLLYWEELSVADIAKVLDIPEGTVKTHLFRGRKALRRDAALLLAGGAS